MTTNDWCITPVSLLLGLCESEGLTDDLNANAGSLNGEGGLCSTGRNDASGVPAPYTPGGASQYPCGPVIAAQPGMGNYGAGVDGLFCTADDTGLGFDGLFGTADDVYAPFPGQVTRLDTCDATTTQRPGGGFGPFVPGAAAAVAPAAMPGGAAAVYAGPVPLLSGPGCAMGPLAAPLPRPISGVGLGLGICDGEHTPFDDAADCTDGYAWTATVGFYSCYVPTQTVLNLPPNPLLATVDFALYYDELYVWWSYDGRGVIGDGSYTASTAPGLVTVGDGSASLALANNDPDLGVGSPLFPHDGGDSYAVEPFPATAALDNAAFWHGHIAMGLDLIGPPTPLPGQSGSAFTMQFPIGMGVDGVYGTVDDVSGWAGARAFSAGRFAPATVWDDGFDPINVPPNAFPFAAQFTTDCNGSPSEDLTVFPALGGGVPFGPLVIAP